MKTIYLFTIDDVSENGAHIEHKAFLSLEMAKAHLQDVRKNFIEETENFKDLYTIYGDDEWEFNVGIDGSYCEDHYNIWIETITLTESLELYADRISYTPEEVKQIISNVVFDALEKLNWDDNVSEITKFIDEQTNKYKSTSYPII